MLARASDCGRWKRTIVPFALIAAGAAACRPPVDLNSDAGSDAMATHDGDAGVDAPQAPDVPCLGAPASAACPACVPGTLVCSSDALAVQRCDADGLGATTVSTCTNGQLCVGGACVDPCDAAAMAHSYQGCEFYAANTLNAQLGHATNLQERDFFPFSIVATNEWGIAATVTVEGGGLPSALQYTVGPHDATRIDLPWILALAEGGDARAVRSTRVAGGAVHVRASIPVAVYQFSPINYLAYHECEGEQCFSYTNDASLLLPTRVLGTQYVAVSRATSRAHLRGATAWTVASGFVTIVGASTPFANVTVRLHGAIAPGDGIPGGAAGDTLSLQLLPGEVVQLVSANDPTCTNLEDDAAHGNTFCVPTAGEDLTGTQILSDQPIAVFSGHDCALVPYNRLACDHLEEQLWPATSLGSHYVVPRTPPADSHLNPPPPPPGPPSDGEPNFVRIVATRDATQVTLAPSPQRTAIDHVVLNSPVMLAHAGDFVEIEQTEAIDVQSTQPVLVAQFLVGGAYFPDDIGNIRGDPDMVLTVPVDQYRNSYQFYTASDFLASSAIAVVPHGEPLLFDGSPLARAPSASLPGYDLYYLLELQGPHRLQAFHAGIRFGLVVSGLDKYCSYTYPGGLDLSPISPPL